MSLQQRLTTEPLEVEIRLGTLVEKASGNRFPQHNIAATAFALQPIYAGARDPNRPYRFEAGVVKAHFDILSKKLRLARQVSRALIKKGETLPGGRAPPKISYDRFTVSDYGADTKDSRYQNEEIRVRTIRAHKATGTKDVVERTVKKRLVDIDISCPGRPYDLRVSISTEKPVDDDVDVSRTQQETREQKRSTFTNQSVVADIGETCIVAVDGSRSAPVYEVEFECREDLVEAANVATGYIADYLCSDGNEFGYNKRNAQLFTKQETAYTRERSSGSRREVQAELAKMAGEREENTKRFVCERNKHVQVGETLLNHGFVALDVISTADSEFCLSSLTEAEAELLKEGKHIAGDSRPPASAAEAE